MIQLPIEIGDTIRVGRFKNKRIVVKEIGLDDYGLPTINGKGILKIRIEKLMPKKEIKENKMNEGSRKLKEFRERGTKVFVKKEDNEFWLYQLGEDGDEECISEIGYKTEELANHAAFMKGFEVVNSKGNKEKIGFDELPDTRLPPKGTKAEPTKFEEPETIDLGSEKKITLESLIRRIIREEKKRFNINELEVTDPDIVKKIEEMARISDEMDRLANELAKLKKQFTPLDEEITRLMEEADATGEQALETQNVLVTIKKKGYEAKSPKYKEAFEELYNKVNAAMKKQVNAILAANTTMKKYGTTIAVQYKKTEGKLNEESLVSRLISKVKSYFSNLWNKLSIQGKQIDAGISAMQRMI